MSVWLKEFMRAGCDLDCNLNVHRSLYYLVGADFSSHEPDSHCRRIVKLRHDPFETLTFFTPY